MKVGLCANTAWYLYNFRKNLIAAIRNIGHDVYVIAPFDDHASKFRDLGAHWSHIELHQTSKNPVTELRTIFQLFRVLGHLQLDMLFTFTVKCNLYAGLVNKYCKFYQVANISGLGEVFDAHTILTAWIRYLYRIALSTSRKVFFQNHEDLAIFIQQGILPARVCERLPGSGVDVSAFTPCFDNLANTQRIFLMFGRIVPQKGYELFLEAARRIRQEQDSKAAFWILGIQDASRKDSLDLFRKILTYHDQHIITYLSPTDDVVPILQQAHVVVLPSHYHEGVPRCLLEAMACGKPIITTDWKGCRETVVHGSNGYLIQKKDQKDLIRAMNRFIQAESDTLYTMGLASRRKAEQEFREEFVIAKYLEQILAHCTQKQGGD